MCKNTIAVDIVGRINTILVKIKKKNAAILNAAVEMEDSIGNAIEKIKLQEQDKEAKLKEKRELEATIASLNKAIREASVLAEKSELDQNILIKKTDLLRKQQMQETNRRDALSVQYNALMKQLEELKAKSKEDIAKVWELRSLFCKDIHSISDNYDVWTLLMKPTCADPVSMIMLKKPTINCSNSENENRLQEALKRRAIAIAERNRLTAEPNNGDEFVRIKKVLRYSLEKIAELNK